MPLFEIDLELLAPSATHGTELEMPLLEMDVELLSPSISDGTELTLPVLDVDIELVAASVVDGTELTMPLLEADVELLSPSVVDGSEIVLPLLAVNAELLSPSVADGSEIVMPLLAVNVELLSPSVVDGTEITMPLLSVGAELLTVSVSDGTEIVMPLLSVDVELLAVSVSDGTTIAMPLLEVGVELQPVIVVNLSLGGISAVLNEIKNTLIADGVGTTESCIVALSRPEPGWNSGDENGVVVIVYPQSATFRQEVLTGGGRETHWYFGEITVEILYALPRDEVGREKSFLTDADSVLAVMSSVLNSLTIYELEGVQCIDPVFPLRTTTPIRKEAAIGSIAVDFEASFKWIVS